MSDSMSDEATVTVEFKVKPSEVLESAIEIIGHDIEALQTDAFRDEEGVASERLLLMVARTALRSALKRYYLPPSSDLRAV
jgi:hypothetical protein